MLIRILVAASLGLVSACALLPAADDALFPLAAQVAELPRSATQTLTARFGEQQLSLQCAFAADGDGWRSVCIGPAGRRLMTLAVDRDRQLTATLDPALPAAFDPRRMAIDIQWAFWPLPALQAAALGTRWQATEPQPGLRQLRRGERLIAEIRHATADAWNGRVEILHHAPAYALDLQTRTADGH